MGSKCGGKLPNVYPARSSVSLPHSRRCLSESIEMSNHNTPPEWAQTYFNDVRDLLGIGRDWELWFALADTPGNNEDADGNCHYDARYLKATITMRRGLVNNEERARYVIMHELLHVALARFDLACDRLINFIPEAHHKHAQELVIDVMEQTIETLTRAFQRGLKPPLGNGTNATTELTPTPDS